jgi:phosphoglycolate phosphatase-like HAD superfamily hydrolase
MIFYAMERLNIQSVRSVIKVGDMAADMLEGRNAGCGGIVGVLSGASPLKAWGSLRHTHVISSVADLPALIQSEFM